LRSRDVRRRPRWWPGRRDEGSEAGVDEPEGDLVGHHGGAWHGGGSVLELRIDVMGDDDAIDGLAGFGKVLAEPAQ
jgi:hypothetical protein